MSKKLYLIRHSYVEDPNGKKDIDRSLTLKGQNYVRTLGRYLINENFDPDIVLCSPSKRTKETGINLVEMLAISEQVIDYQNVLYNASVREMLGVVNNVESNCKEVTIIGHNPTITYFGEFLTGSDIGNMESAGVVIIEFAKLKWNEITQNTGIFKSYYHPDH